MRMFGLIALVGALLIVGILVKKQSLDHEPMTVPAIGGPASALSDDAPPSTPRAQSRQLQQDVQRSLDAAVLQQRRMIPEDQ